MTIVYGIRPAWGLPCVSPFVTKVVYLLRLAGLPFELRAQDPMTLALDSPNGKLPYLVEPDGLRIADSEAIRHPLATVHGADLDADTTAGERAMMTAFTRLVDEHLYWLAVVRPRWTDDTQWPRYRALLFGERSTSAQVAMSDTARAHIIAQWVGTGLGRLPAALADERARTDVQALAARLAEWPFVCGDRLRSVDAGVTAMLVHVLESPFVSAARDEAERHPQLAAYVERVRGRFDV